MRKVSLACVMMAALLFCPMHARAVEETEVPEDIIEISEELGGQYNICPELIQAVCWKESRFKSDAQGGGCKGIMQVSPKWHKDRMNRLGVTDIYDTYGNMLTATDYLAELFDRYGDVGIVLMVYNGDSRAEKIISGGDGDLSEYANEILEMSVWLEVKHGK